MQKWICTICKYVYDPINGDMESDIAPGILFEYLPDEWACPFCGSGKEVFEKLIP